jgi:hypothetical protein
LIISLIIKIKLVWLSRSMIMILVPVTSFDYIMIIDTSKNQPERLNSDNQINLSSLIDTLK